MDYLSSYWSTAKTQAKFQQHLAKLINMRTKKKLSIIAIVIVISTLLYFVMLSYKNMGSQLKVPEISQKSISICNAECKRFRRHLLEQWPNSKPKSAIYVLSHYRRLRSLKIFLNSIDRNFNSIYKYPIIVFHDADLIPFIPNINQSTTSQLYFQEVTFEIPRHLKDPIMENIPCLSKISYRHMCRFQAKMVYREQILQGLDYFWRLDDDSLLTEPIKYDIFKFMQQHNYLYGYIWLHLDAYQCTTGLWEASQRYIEKHNILTKFFKEWHRPTIYYNNFEISSSKIWKSPEYQNYINYIDSIGGIYYFRWGDAPIKGIAISMFVPKNRTHLFSDIGYKHTSFQTKVSHAMN